MAQASAVAALSSAVKAPRSIAVKTAAVDQHSVVFLLEYDRLAIRRKRIGGDLRQELWHEVFEFFGWLTILQLKATSRNQGVVDLNRSCQTHIAAA